MRVETNWQNLESRILLILLFFLMEIYSTIYYFGKTVIENCSHFKSIPLVKKKYGKG